jgi:ribonuclease BN (tRNA processing enzyme)
VDYGHSSSAKGIDLAFKSNVKKIVFFHIEPVYDDEHIFDLHIRAINYKTCLKKNMNSMLFSLMKV